MITDIEVLDAFIATLKTSQGDADGKLEFQFVPNIHKSGLKQSGHTLIDGVVCVFFYEDDSLKTWNSALASGVKALEDLEEEPEPEQSDFDYVRNDFIMQKFNK